MGQDDSKHMRQWFVVRHAKSSWKDPTLVDHERPLNKRGRRAATWLGETILAQQWQPQRILCSDAKRAQETLMGMRHALEAEVDILEDLYLCDVATIMRHIDQLPSHVQSVMTIGHNPTCEALVAHLCGRDVRITTANIVCLSGSAQDWGAVQNWRCDDILRPRPPGSGGLASIQRAEDK